MKIVGFLQNRNNMRNGFLDQCLSSMSKVTDEIVVYDDASFEEYDHQWAKNVYDDFECTVIYGMESRFQRELFCKQELLYAALLYKPDWIVWFDTDCVLSRCLEERSYVEEMLADADVEGADLIELHNLNLWRSTQYYRTDEAFNDLWHGVFWRNTGELHYRPTPGLHQRQYPFFYRDQAKNDALSTLRYGIEDEEQLIHFGFSDEREIAQKYYRYRDYGQSGWALDRLDGGEDVTVGEVPSPWMPSGTQVRHGVGIWSMKLDRYDNYQQWEKHRWDRKSQTKAHIAGLK